MIRSRGSGFNDSVGVSVTFRSEPGSGSFFPSCAVLKNAAVGSAACLDGGSGPVSVQCQCFGPLSVDVDLGKMPSRISVQWNLFGLCGFSGRISGISPGVRRPRFENVCSSVRSILEATQYASDNLSFSEISQS